MLLLIHVMDKCFGESVLSCAEDMEDSKLNDEKLSQVFEEIDSVEESDNKHTNKRPLCPILRFLSLEDAARIGCYSCEFGPQPVERESPELSVPVFNDILIAYQRRVHKKLNPRASRKDIESIDRPDRHILFEEQQLSPGRCSSIVQSVVHSFFGKDISRLKKLIKSDSNSSNIERAIIHPDSKTELEKVEAERNLAVAILEAAPAAWHNNKQRCVDRQIELGLENSNRTEKKEVIEMARLMHDMTDFVLTRDTQMSASDVKDFMEGTFYSLLPRECKREIPGCVRGIVGEVAIAKAFKSAGDIYIHGSAEEDAKGIDFKLNPECDRRKNQPQHFDLKCYASVQEVSLVRYGSRPDSYTRLIIPASMINLETLELYPAAEKDAFKFLKIRIQK